jgi:hypothetical protein
LVRRNGTKSREKKNHKPSKYRNVKTIIDDICFDSKAEAQYYVDLKEKKQKGEIADFKCQVDFTLQEGYISPSSGKKARPIIYRADFVVTHTDGSEDIIDVKGSRGYQTEVFKLKHKLFEYKFKVPLKIVTVKVKS